MNHPDDEQHECKDAQQRILVDYAFTIAWCQFTTLFFIRSKLWRNVGRQFIILFSWAGNSQTESQQLVSISVHNYIFTPQDDGAVNASSPRFRLERSDKF